MAGEWPQKPLGMLVQNFDARRVPLSSREREKRRGQYPYHGATGVMAYVDDFLFQGLHLLVAEDGSVETVDGKPFLQLVDGQFWVNNHAHVLKGTTDEDTKFLYYALSTVAIRPFMSGSVQAKLSQGNLNKVPVPYPPDDNVRRAIAHILGTLDDKIELNRRTSETLEAIAQALFKSWFVDFDPVRAKSEGRDPGLPPHLADLFPNSFEDSELGEIPTGWEVAPISEIADVIDCSHAKKPIRRAHGWPLLQLANIRSDGLLDMSDTYLIDRTEYELWTARIEASPGDCVITNVGRVGAVAQVPAGVRAALGRNMTALRCKMSFPFPTLLLEALVSDAVQDEVALNTDSGTILDSLNVRSIPKLRFVVPAANVARGFEALARPLRAKMELNLVESRSLGALRDAFLPKLISGQTRLRGAERLTDAV